MKIPVSNKLGQILDKMVESAVKRRYQSATEVLQALNSAKASSTVVHSHQPGTPKIPSHSPDHLRSEVGVDYTNLRNFLRNGMWRKADEETDWIMLKVSKREEEGWLRAEDIENFPYTDLCTIDQLWVKYSKGRFGFSVQKRIFFEVGGRFGKVSEEVWESFGDRVGWRENNSWLYYSDLAFSQLAPVGHLPEETQGMGWIWVSSLAQRLIMHKI